MEERGRFKRINKNIQVKIDTCGEFVPGSRNIKGFTVNVSAGGVCIRTEKELSVGEVINIKFNIDDTILTIASEIVRKDRNSNGIFCYGVNFMNITDYLRRKIIQTLVDRSG